MISVVIPTLNAENNLGRCLAALIPATVEGVVRQVVVADGGSTDHTRKIVDDAGADLVETAPGRGHQIRAGIDQARCPWILVLHSDTVLETGWDTAASQFMETVDIGRRPTAAAAFRFALDDDGIMPRALETAVNLRATWAKRPYGDQALLIPRRLLDEIGGYKPLRVMEDLDIVRRLGRRRVKILRPCAITSAERYIRDGYLKRIARNQACLMMHAVGIPNDKIARFYQGSTKADVSTAAGAEAANNRAAAKFKTS
jgi:rSAM/selenodomain-associated transferase 2